jgi:hypothetical protein
MVASAAVTRRIRGRAGRRKIDGVVALKWRGNLSKKAILWPDLTSQPAECWLDSLFKQRASLAQWEAQ